MKATAEQAERAHRFAHDLRNRLAAIQQVLVQLKDAPTDPTNAELFDFAEQQYFKAMRATEELLDDLEVERGVGALQHEVIDLGALVRSAIGSMQHRFDRKEQEVRIELDADLMASVDPHWIMQLVSALLSNASKFTAAKGSVHVVLQRANNSALLSITDTGVGLDAEDLAHVFTRYAWLKSRSTAGEAQGRSTLARAKQWAQAHGGDLAATSEGPGHGCAFTLRLPL